MLFTFEAFSLSLSDLGTTLVVKMLFVSVLQVIAKLTIPIVISSGVSIVFKLFVPVCRILPDYWKDFMSLVFAPLKCFMTALRVRLGIFQSLMSLTIESPNMTVTGRLFLSGVSLSVLSLEFCVFSVAVLVVFCFAVFLCGL